LYAIPTRASLIASLPSTAAEFVGALAKAEVRISVKRILDARDIVSEGEFNSDARGPTKGEITCHPSPSTTTSPKREEAHNDLEHI